MKLRTIIVDDEALARQGLMMRLESFEDVEIVQEAKNAKEALEAIVTFEPDLSLIHI